MVMVRNMAACCLLLMLSFTAGAQQMQAGEMECLTCHSAPSLREVRTGGKEKSNHADIDSLASSVHSRLKCLDCHTDFRGKSLPHMKKAQAVQCAKCHHDGNHVGAPNALHVDLYADSVHGNALRKGDPDAPTCQTCHGSHDIRSARDSASATYRTRIPATCGKCHFDTSFARRHKLASVRKYSNSVHARHVVGKDGLGTAAVCTDCHGVHDIQAPGQRRSSVSRSRMSETCGKCHKEVSMQYESSIHGKAVAKGVKKAPVCTDCHGEHLILEPSSPESPVSPTHVVATCSKCHEDVRIQRKYGLPADRLSSYISSYHGVANKFGDVTVANCATCHGAHNVLPSKDRRSTVNKTNLAKTCGKCHPGASKNFAVGSIHVVPSPKQDVVVFWVRTFYLLFVVGLISAFCGYIFLDLRARWIGRLPWRRGGHRR